jgi:transposase
MNKIVGIDLGDKLHHYFVLATDGQELAADTVPNTKPCIESLCKQYPGATFVMEAGTHSPWISRTMDHCGCKAHVVNPRNLRAIWDSDNKNDRSDARTLALLYRGEPRLLPPVFHRGEQAQADLAVVHSRENLMAARKRLINSVRALVKSFGERLPGCTAASFHKTRASIPKALEPALEPLYTAIEVLGEQIKEMDRTLSELQADRYPETEYLQQVPGVGPLTAMTFILTLESPGRFRKSREVGAYLGLVPRRDQSGSQDKQLSITKTGDRYLRSLLVNCAQYILGQYGPDTDLRRHGLKLAERGGKNAKKRAVVATARKLSVLLHRLWADQSEYVPLRKHSNAVGKEEAA